MIKTFIWMCVAALLGALSAAWMAGLLPYGPRVSNALVIDGWQTDLAIGAETADPYLKARVARHGLLALRREEAVYFISNTDQAGNRLTETCSYEVRGKAMPAGWWSITLYDAKSRLPMNTDQALSFDASDVETDSDGETTDWSFIVSPILPLNENSAWVSSLAAGHFDLTLRLYRPNSGFLDTLDAPFQPPSIRKLHCREASIQ